MYRNLNQVISDLEKNSQLIRISEQVDPNLQMAEIHRRVFAADGPAILYERVKGSPFPAVSNLFGTIERARFLFRDTLATVKKMIDLKANPRHIFKNPAQSARLPFAAMYALPMRVNAAGVGFKETQIDQLPQIKSWPQDGGAFITLPQVLSLDPNNPALLKSNLGMYRVQLSGNDYKPNEQLGLHYQIHRGIGVHHATARQKGQPLKVSIFIGGPPAHTFSAVMPLPEGLSELSFAGVLGGRRFRYFEEDGHILSADADFVITGTIEEDLLPEGPFGDHLGYYSLVHNFPVFKVNKVYHRPQAIWPFTVVGRTPQEDSIFGALIHEMTGPMIPASIPGLKAVHAVDAAGVHPLLLAIGSERYVPYAKRQPQELLTIANAVLGFGQLSLAKYLFIAADEDNPDLQIQDIAAFFHHILERVDWRRDLHFQTCTTMDTLDYSAEGLNQGSKVVIAAAGDSKRHLETNLSSSTKFPNWITQIETVLPGILVLQGTAFQDAEKAIQEVKILTDQLDQQKDLNSWPLMVLVDDAAFCAAELDNFLWVTFTRSDPASDIYGSGNFIKDKHWGCSGPLIIDARIKPHHAPVLESDPAVVKSVDDLAIHGKSLYGII